LSDLAILGVIHLTLTCDQILLSAAVISNCWLRHVIKRYYNYIGYNSIL